MKQGLGKEVLLVTTAEEDRWKDSIYAIGAGNGITRVKISAQYHEEFTQMRAHNDSLYGIYGRHVYDILNDKEVAEIGGYRSPSLESLASHDGKLYCSDDGICSDSFFGSSWSTAPSIYDAETKKEVRCKRALAMVSHKGKLYAGGLGWVYDVLTGKNIHTHKEWAKDPAGRGWDDPQFSMKFMPNWAGIERIISLASHKEGLYFGCKRNSKGARGIYEAFTKEKVAERSEDVTALASYNGMLIDATGSAIYCTLKDEEGKKPVWEFNGQIKDIASIPAEVWNALVKKGRAALKKGRIAQSV